MVRGAALFALALAVVSCSERETVTPIFNAERQAIVNIDPNGVRISELHYDNDGTDTGERIEISGPAGKDLTGWSVVLYNGNTATAAVTYGTTRSLNGVTIPSSCGDRGVIVLEYPRDGLQNGARDGIALMNGSTVVEFLSYEGTFTPSNGPALGKTPTDIGVSQSDAPEEVPGSSLQRTDAAGNWIATPGATANTFGACNDNGGVVVGPVAIVTVSPATQTIETGQPFTFTAEAFDANNNKVNNATFTWTSSDETVAAHPVNGSGIGLKATSAEGITITVSANNIPATAKLIVKDPLPPEPLSDVRFSELHYDNAGTDVGEAIEVEAPAGTNLAGWQILWYNGNGGVVYFTQPLLGVVLERCNGRGVIAVDATAIQNGPDAIALIDPQGNAVEFISYGGAAFQATDGAAAGKTSTPIGVSESSAAVGTSLWRNAAGAWQGSRAQTFGACNENDVPPPAAPALVITEVMGNPLQVADDAGEWFEVFNPTNETVDLFNWIITSSSTAGPELHQIAQHISVGPKGFVVFGNNTNSATNGGVAVAYSYGESITLSNSTTTDFVELKDPGVRSVDRVEYNGLLPVAGRARHVLDASFDNLQINGINWEEAFAPYNDADFGTPGTGDYGERGPVVTVEIFADAPYVSTTGSRQFRARGRDAQGRTVGTPVTWSSSNTAIATIDAAGLARGASTGDVTIRATAPNGAFGEMQLKVMAPGTPAFTTVTTSGSIPPAGYQRRIFYNVFDADGAVVANVSPSDISWSTSDAVVATVSLELGDRAYMNTHQAGAVRIVATHVPSGATGFLATTIQPNSVPTSAVYRHHLEFGVPTDSDPSDDFLLNRSQFSLSYNTLRGSPNWVSWNINKTQFGPVPRCDCFSEDPNLPGDRVHDVDYINSGYSRGHMVQSESRTTTAQENAATFLMSNIVPQTSDNNEGPWLAFENHLNNLARNDNKEIYVIAGGQYAATPPTLNNARKVQIPDYTWKVAVIVDAGEGLLDVNNLDDLQVVAIRIPNLLTTSAGIKPNPWEMYEVTVDQIEAAVGYDVLSALADQIEIAVESKTKPPVARVNGPHTSTEGSAFTLSGAASSDPDAGQVLTYSWNFGDGNTGTGSAVTHTYAQDGTYTVTLTVTDPYGLTSTTTTTATIANDAPVIDAFAGATLLPGETYNAAGSFTDAGSDVWTATIDYGDGAVASALALSGKTFALTHQYNTAGVFTVTVVVNDDDVSATRTQTVTVLSIAQALQNAIAAVDQLVATGKINNGNGTSLKSKIQNAASSLQNGNVTAGVNQLQAVLNEIDALVAANRLSAADAAALRSIVTRAIQSVSE